MLFLKIKLVPSPGIEPAPPALEAQSLNLWTTREGPIMTLIVKENNCSLVQDPSQPHTAFRGHVSSVSFNLNQFSGFVFHDLDIYEEPRQLFCRM